MADHDCKIFGFQIGGNNPMENLWTSYYDQVDCCCCNHPVFSRLQLYYLPTYTLHFWYRDASMMAVNIRRETAKKECEAAYKTLLKIYDDKKPPIGLVWLIPAVMVRR
jgi:hypothetical protein